MIKGIYAAASAMVAGMNQQAVLSHNITNLDTPGFKQVLMTKEEWEKTAVSQLESTNSTEPSFLGDNTTSNSLGDLGLGVQTSSGTDDLSQGPLETTNEPLDMALQGDGFFKVNTPEGDRYTRDGRFHLDASNNLVTVDGNYVLDSNGNHIKLSDTNITVKSDGTIEDNGSAVAKLSISSFTTPSTDLERDQNMFKSIGSPVASTAEVVNNSLEGSNVDYTQATTQLLSIARSYEAAQQMVTVQDGLLGKAISSLGKFV